MILLEVEVEVEVLTGCDMPGYGRVEEKVNG
jgi:hypothetical protein